MHPAATARAHTQRHPSCKILQPRIIAANEHPPAVSAPSGPPAARAEFPGAIERIVAHRFPLTEIVDVADQA
jgi:hypothetical protein